MDVFGKAASLAKAMGGGGSTFHSIARVPGHALGYAGVAAGRALNPKPLIGAASYLHQAGKALGKSMYKESADYGYQITGKGMGLIMGTGAAVAGLAAVGAAGDGKMDYMQSIQTPYNPSEYAYTPEYRPVGPDSGLSQMVIDGSRNARRRF